ASLKVKVYIIDEAHMLTPEAFNALLKTLEEPPAHVLFVLATTEPHKITLTVVSRCQRFDFRRIETESIATNLASIVTREGVKVDQASLALIARLGQGSMRDGVTLLDQLISQGVSELTVERTRELRKGADARLLLEVTLLQGMREATGSAAEHPVAERPAVAGPALARRPPTADRSGVEGPLVAQRPPTADRPAVEPEEGGAIER